jgi:hypothetical protein
VVPAGRHSGREARLIDSRRVSGTRVVLFTEHPPPSSWAGGVLCLGG